MDEDALSSARSIRQEIKSTGDIYNAFDGLTYNKGGGVLSMFESYLGPDKFRDGCIYAFPRHSVASSPCVEGDRMMMALMRIPAGTTSEPHSHPNEQWIYLLEGTFDFTIDGQRRFVRPGSLIYIPANTIHSATATPEADVVFFTAKDGSHSLHGTKAAAE